MLKFKKMFATLVLGLSLMLGSQMVSTNTAAAQDVWAYSFKLGGGIYVMSETVWYEKYRGYHVTIKDVESDGSYSIVKLFYTQDVGGWWYRDETNHRYPGPMCKATGDPKMESIINVALRYAK